MLNMIRTMCLACLFVAALQPCFANLEEGWSLLLQNRYAESATALQSVEGPEREAALQALLFNAWAQGEYPDAAAHTATLIEEFPDSAYLPAYLAVLSQPAFKGWALKDRAMTLRKALAKNPSASHRQRLEYELMQTLDLLLDSAAGAAAREAGVLIDHWQVVGAFGRYGAADFVRPFGPEIEWKDEYESWYGTAAFRAVDPPDSTGSIDLSGLVYPANGVAYLMNVIETNDDAEAELLLTSPSDLRVWLNGEPVVEKNHLALQTAQTVSAKVTLNAGRNLLVIKTMSTGQWSVRARLHAIGDHPLTFKTAAFDRSEWASLYLKPFEGRVPLPEINQGLFSRYPFELPEPANPSARIGRNLLQAVWHTDRYELDAARTWVQDVIKKEDAFAFAHWLQGDLALRQAQARPGSGARFQQEAEQAFQSALAFDPASKPALVGLQSFYLDRDQTDQALELTRNQSAEAPALRGQGYQAQLDFMDGVLYSRKGFGADARRRFEDAQVEFVPTFDVYTRLFDDYYAHRVEDRAGKLIEDCLAAFPAYLPFIQRAAQIKGSPMAKQAIQNLETLIQAHPYTMTYGLELGIAYERQGQSDKAIEAYQSLNKMFPNHPQPMNRLASLQMRQGETQQALASYHAVHQQEPRWMDAFRVLRDVEGKDDFPYMEYDVSLDDIEIDMADRWENSRGAGVYLLDIMVLEYHQDGTYDMYVHQAIKVLSQEGVRKWAEMVIPQGGNVELIHARTITPDGIEWSISHLQDLNNQQSLSMYGIEEGAVLEYAYLQRSGRKEPGVRPHSGGYYFGADDDPMLLSKLAIVVPDGLPFNTDKNPHDLAPQVIEKDGKRIMLWENWMQDGLKPERFAPNLYQRVPSVQWTTGRDWLPFVERYRVSKYGYQEDSDLVRQLADSFLEKSKSKQELLQAVYDWISTNIEDGSGGQTSVDTLTQKSGGRYQKMRLMRHILQLCGLKTQMALALDGKREEGVKPLPFPNYQGSVLLRVPEQAGVDRPIHIDFSSRFASLGQVDPFVRKQVALIYDGPVPYFTPLQSELWEHGLLERDISAVLREDHSAQVEGTYTYGNLFDLQIREALTNPEIRDRLADAQAANDFRGIKLDSTQLTNVDDLSVSPQLVFAGQLPDVAQPDQDGSLRIEAAPIRSQAAALVSEATRQFPLVFSASPVQDHLNYEIDLSQQIDQGARVVLPENALLLTSFGYYSLFFEWDGAKVLVRRSFLIPSQTIQPTDYSEFVEFCREIDQVENRVVRIFPQG
ncbi:MAG: DUF3857 domain-containing protein [Candidatus Hinthialibacter antarcticus]|nr:DUF3857 domain-containing protein [Candidatus Hinthialibacter antarcticus]